MQQFPVLENSTSLLIFTGTSGCRASVNLIFLVIFPTIFANTFLDAGQVLIQDIVRPVTTLEALFSHFLSASLVCRCSYVAYIANNTDPDQTAPLVNISFHENSVCSAFECMNQM